MSTDLQNIFSARLSKARNLRKLKGKELALLVNKSGPAITGYESGANFPDVPTLTALADALNISTDWLLGRSSAMEVPKGDGFLVPDVPETLRGRLDLIAKRNHFANKEEFVRHIMRSAVNSASAVSAGGILDAAEKEAGEDPAP